MCIVLSNVKKSSYRDSKVLKQAAEPLHKAGVRVIAIGATSSAGRNQLRALTEHPADVIRSSSCDGLESKFSFLFQRICYGAGKGFLCVDLFDYKCYCSLFAVSTFRACAPRLQQLLERSSISFMRM